MSAAAVILMMRAKCLRAFREAQATTPETAKALEKIGVGDSNLFRRLVSGGVIVEVPGNRYYLSEPEVKKSDARLWVIMWLAIIIGLTLALVYANK